jgi:hypothetical protein
VVGGSEEEFRSGGSFDRFVAVELGTVVGGDGTGEPSGVVDQVDRSAVGGHDGTGFELTDHDVSTLTIDEGEDAVLVGDVTDDGIGFEVTDTASVLGPSGTLRDGTFTGELPTGIVGTVTFYALFGKTAQVLVEVSIPLSITPDMAVDSLVADREPPLMSQPASGLLRAPLLLDARLDLEPIGWAKALIAT